MPGATPLALLLARKATRECAGNIELTIPNSAGKREAKARWGRLGRPTAIELWAPLLVEVAERSQLLLEVGVDG